MNYIKKLAVEYAILHIIPMLEFRNHNEIYDIKINNKWYYFNPNKHNYNDTYDEVFYHIKTYFNLLSNILDEEDKTDNNVYNTKKKEIKDIYKKADSKFINLIVKKIFEYIKKNVPNTAFNDRNDDIPLPVELTDMIYQYVPNDTNMDLINKIKNKIMLPKNEIIVELIKFFPHIENEPEIIKIYCKYIDLYSIEKVINLLRNKLCDEYYAKKSFPKNNDGKFLPISKDDFKIFKKYLHFDKTSLCLFDQLNKTIHFSMKQLLYSEIKNLRKIKTFEKYDYFKIESKCFGEFTEIEIFQKIFVLNYEYKFYKNCWEIEIPELLTNSTNTLTSRDLYMIKQYPNWVKSFLEQLSTNILNMITYLNKLVKYDKLGMSMIEKVEKLIKLQNEYQYHDLQRYKNECKNELRKIEKFTK
jgi:hypothetical protein